MQSDAKTEKRVEKHSKQQRQEEERTETKEGEDDEGDEDSAGVLSLPPRSATRADVQRAHLACNQSGSRILAFL